MIPTGGSGSRLSLALVAAGAGAPGVPCPYVGGLRNTLQAWKQRVKGQGSLPFRTSRSLRGCVGSLERMCWM